MFGAQFGAPCLAWPVETLYFAGTFHAAAPQDELSSAYMIVKLGESAGLGINPSTVGITH